MQKLDYHLEKPLLSFSGQASKNWSFLLAYGYEYHSELVSRSWSNPGNVFKNTNSTIYIFFMSEALQWASSTFTHEVRYSIL